MKIKSNRMLISTVAIAFLSLILIGIPSSEVLAEGDEILGLAQIDIEDGTDIVAAGIGLEGTTSGTITVDVPTGATVQQVLLYWGGEASLGDPGDATVIVDGNARTGTLIGTSNLTSDTATTYRDDITDLGLVDSGSNTLLIEDLDYQTNYGAGVLVIIDDGSGLAEIDVRDGADHAFIGNSVPDLQVTELQTYNFTPATFDRDATLIMFFGDVIPGRSNEIEIFVGNNLTLLVNPLASMDGLFWDTVIEPFTIPAGVSQVTVQTFSRGEGLSSSLAWNLATLSIGTEEEFGTGRFTGGGGQIRVDGVRVTRGLTIHCDLLLSNNLQVNWQGNRFHMAEHLETVECSDSPDIIQFPPAAPLDTLIGIGTGRYNGQYGFTIEFTLVDAGEPGREDEAAFLIYETANPANVVLNVPLQLLDNGNLQAHEDQPHR